MLKNLLVLLLIGFASFQTFAASGITYHGRILRSNSTPIDGQFVGFRLRIMDGDTGTCQMYEEIQTKDMRNSNGVFSIVIGDGSVVGTYGTTGISFFDGLFQNSKTYNFAVSHACEFLPYAAAARHGRKLNVSFRENPAAAWEDMPTMNIEHVPFAFSALTSQKVGNHGDGSLLRVENAGNPQAIPALTPTQYSELFDLVQGNSTQYIQSVLGTAGQISVNTAAGVATVGLPDVATAGTYGSATQVPVFVLDAKGRITSVTNTTITGAAPTGAAGGDLTGNFPSPDIAALAVGTPELAAGAVTDAKLATDSVTTIKIVDANVTLNKLATDSVNSAKIVDGSIVGADISSTANLSVASVTATGAVTSDSVSTRSIGLFELPVNGTNYVAHKAPDSLAGNTTYTWPAAAPGSNMVLQSDASGNLSWVADATGAAPGDATYAAKGVVQFDTDAATSGITVASGIARIATGGVSTGMLANDAVTFAKIQNITDNRLLGRSAGSAGDMQEITIGTGLDLTAGVLTATATAPGDASYAAKGIVQFDTDAATSGITVAGGIAKLATSGVAANTYGSASAVPVIAVDAFGRITTATTTNIAIAASQVTSGVLDVARGGTGTGTLTANRMFIANGTGTALVADTCTVNQVLQYNGTTWVCVATTGFGPANAYVQNGNAFAAKAVLGTTDNNDLEFITNNTAKMTVLAGGNVGIGNSSPGAKLQVDGNIILHQASDARASGFSVRNTGSSRNGYFWMNGDALTLESGIGNTPIVLNPTGTGNVGIGQATPSAKLDVKGDFAISGSTSGAVKFAVPAAAGSATYTWPAAAPGSNMVLQSDASGVLSWVAQSAGGLTHFTESVNTAAPNATVPAVRLIATNAATDVDAVISPKGVGALLGDLPDNASTGGNKRGAQAVDLQMSRDNADEVAAGYRSVITGGHGNKVGTSTAYAVINGGSWNIADGNVSNVTIGGGDSNYASGNHSTIGGGQGNQASNWYSTVGGGDSNSATGYGATVPGGMHATAESYSQTTVGRYNMPKGSETAGSWVSTDPLFVVGNGTGSGASRSNAMMILKDGSTGIGTVPTAKLDVKGDFAISGATSGAVKFAVPAAAGTATYTWPAAAPGSNMILQSDNAGNLSWVADATGGAPGDASYAAKGIVQFDTDAATSGITVASGVARIATGGVSTGMLANDAVTFAKIQNITDNRILGRSAGSAGDMQEITIGTGLDLTAGVLTATATAPGDASYAAKGIVQFDTDAATSGITVAGGVAKLATSGVAANTYGSASAVPVIAVDAFGRITTATTTNIAIAASQVTSGVLDVARGGTGTGTLTANRMFIANGTGTALTADTCTVNQVLQYNGTTWVCVATTGFGPANAYVQNGNAFAAKAVLGTTDNNDLEFITNNTAKMTVKADGTVNLGGATQSATRFSVTPVEDVTLPKEEYAMSFTPGDSPSGFVSTIFGYYDNGAGDVSFMQTNNSGFNGAMALQPYAGYVGINTLTPGAPLDVKGIFAMSGSTSGSVKFAVPAAAGSATYTWPAAAPGSNMVLQSNSSGVLSWVSQSAGGLTHFTESVNTAAPNATVPVVRLLATNAATNVDIALSPKGSGALTAQVADGAFTAGNKRGQYSVDWQMARSGATQVASGAYAAVSGGQANTASGNYSVVAGGVSNTASIAQASVLGGNGNTASGASSTVLGGILNTASGTYSMAAGNTTTAESQSQVTFGAYNMPKGSETAASWVSTDPLFVIGNGTGSGASRSNALMILKDGSTGIGTVPTAKLDVKGDFAISGSTSGAVKFAVPAAAGSATYTWPAAAPGSNMVLQSDNTGALSWVAAGGSGDFLANGTVNMTGAFKAVGGAEATPGITFVGDTNTGIGSDSDGLMFFSSNGSSAGQISNNGLEMNRVIKGMGTTTAGAPSYSFTGAANADTGIFNPANDVIAMSTAGTERMRILADGKVGVGTTAPTSTFHVVDTKAGAYNAASLTPAMRIATVNNAAANAEYATLQFHINSQNGGGANAYANITGIQTSTGSNGGELAFGVRTGAGAQIEAMRIDALGKLGIGTTAPSAKLDVKGDFAISGSTSGAVKFAVPAAAGSATYTWPAAAPGSNMVLQSDNTGTLSWVANGSGGLPAADGSAAAPSINFTNSSTTGFYRASAGVIGISTAGTSVGTISGTTLNVAGLDVSSNSLTANTVTSNGNVVAAGRMVAGVGTDADALSALTVSFTSSNMIRATAASGACGTLNFTNVAAGGSYTVTIPNATATCTTIHLNGATTNVKLPSGYGAGGVACAGAVYTAIYDGTTLWVSYVPF